jgi:two-component system, cell cycle sensor histidine kinase and response regulator CckA
MPTSALEPFFDLCQDLLGILDSDDAFVCVSASFERDLGWSARTLAGRPFLSLIHDNDAAAAAGHLRDLATANAQRPFDTLVRDAGGAYRRVRWHISRPEVATQTFIVGRLADDSRKTSGPAHLAAQVLGELASHISDFLWVRDAKTGSLLYLNDVWERITGQRVKVGDHYKEFFKATHPDDVSEARDASRREALLGGYDQTVRVLDTTRASRWMRVRTFPVRDASGEVYRVVGIAEEVTELRHAEEALQNSAQRFKSLIEHSSDLILLVDAAGRFTYLSPSFETTLGYRLADWINRQGFDLVWRDDLEAARLLHDRIVSTPGVAMPWQMRVRHADGTSRWLEGTSANHLADPAIAAVIVNCRDVTERKRMEAQFIQAQKMESIGRLAGGVAHDFNNLLTAIKGNISLALLDMQPIDPLYEYLTSVDEAADSAASLTRQLLTFSRKQIISPKVINLNNVLKHVQRLLARLIGEDIHLELFAAADLASVRLDRSQAEQVLINLAVNARDAMPQGGRLTIETANIDLDEEYAKQHPYVQPGSYVMLAVADTGAGMQEEVRAHLFEPFFTTKESGGGTGLGLSMVYGAVKQNGGHIEVYSEPGHGATFKIFLPAVAQAPDATVETMVEPRPRGDETIVLVEDEEHVRSIASLMLRRQGYTVHAFPDGPTALAAVEAMPDNLDLVITDVIMPKMNGQVLTQRLLQLRPSIRVLFTSGYTANVIVHHGVLNEGVEFLSKPYSLERLTQRVREVLDKPQP